MSHGHNKEFLKDPVAYLGGAIVLTLASNFRPSPAAFKDPSPSVSMDLVYVGKWKEVNQVRADFSTTPPGGDEKITGAWIPYESEGNVKADSKKLPVQVLPAAGDAGPFAFTGAMNGCSLVMATKGGQDYGIHVPNSQQATENYPFITNAGYQYTKSLDYYPLPQRRQGFYGTDGNRDAGGGRWYNTFAFFYRSGGQWKIIAQPQFATMIEKKFVAERNGSVIVVD